ncbi:allantoinase AllB [Aquipuribacter sp. MA13-6]|uniref:allantoinase AllB n=1 Tax=unclassified Aquipuribacter TaxID=2635084 RepID=UPI003EE95D6D
MSRDLTDDGLDAGTAQLDLLLLARRAVVHTVDGPVERPAVVGVRDGRVVLLHDGHDPGAGGSGGVDLAYLPEPADLPTAARVVELADDEVLLPGLVDSHVHVNEPGRTHWEGFATATRAAAAGGTTTLVDMPLNSVPPTTTVANLRAKQEAAQGRTYVDVAFWGGAVPENLADLGPLHDAGVLGFKSFLAPSGVPEFGHLDEATLREVLTRVAALDATLVVHAEDPGVLAGAPEATGPRYADFLASRPDSSEVVAVERLLGLAADAGARVHVLHLSSAAALPALAAARSAGQAVTVETCPHYLVLAAEDVPDGATTYKCCPPIRDAANADALWRALADGVIDCVVSDHSPSTEQDKRLDTGDFGDAWGGISSLQLLLPLLWTEARARGFTLADVVRWAAVGPARVARLDTLGRLAVGAPADLVVLAPDEPFVVDPDTLHHRNRITAYAGRTLTGTVRSTWLAGVEVDLTAEPRGRLLTRGDA